MGSMSRRLVLSLALAVASLPAGCVFGSDMTAEKLEGEVALEGNELFSIEDRCTSGRRMAAEGLPDPTEPCPAAGMSAE
jgi:hypothetical protein